MIHGGKLKVHGERAMGWLQLNQAFEQFGLSPVQREGFHQVWNLHGFPFLKVSRCSGHSEDAVVGTRAEFELHRGSSEPFSSL